MDAVLNRKQRATPPVPRIFDGEKEVRLIALACSQPPEGRAAGLGHADDWHFEVATFQHRLQLPSSNHKWCDYYKR